MADTAASSPSARKASSKLWSGPLARAIFLAASIFAAAGVLAALFGGGASGPQGMVLLAGVAASAFALILAMAAGNAAGQAMGERAARDERPGAASLALRALEASPDPALISDLRGAPH